MPFTKSSTSNPCLRRHALPFLKFNGAETSLLLLGTQKGNILAIRICGETQLSLVKKGLMDITLQQDTNITLSWAGRTPYAQGLGTISYCSHRNRIIEKEVSIRSDCTYFNNMYFLTSIYKSALPFPPLCMQASYSCDRNNRLLL
jgi:hypothetical protein